MQTKLEVATLELFFGRRVSEKLVTPAVPQKHASRAIIPCRDGAFEVAILDRMILNMHGEALLFGVQSRAFGNGPGLQNSAHFQAQIVMEPSGAMSLNAKAVSLFLELGWRRLWRLGKAPFAGVIS